MKRQLLRFTFHKTTALRKAECARTVPNVSEEYTASIFEAENYSEISINTDFVQQSSQNTCTQTTTFYAQPTGRYPTISRFLNAKNHKMSSRSREIIKLSIRVLC
jgi:hypothetical protein